MKSKNLGILALVALGLSLGACGNKDESAMGEAMDAMGDATNTRDNEEFKDAAEDAGDAMENAADGAKEAMGIDEK